MTKPIIIVSITGRSRKDIFEEACEMKKVNVPMVEWRADLLEDLHVSEAMQIILELKEILQKIPLIFTYRTIDEGGEGRFLPEETRDLILAVIHQKQVNFVDIEYKLSKEILEFLLEEAKRNDILTILSSHDFVGTTEQNILSQQFEEMNLLEATVLKIVTMANSSEDVLNLMKASYKFTTQHSRSVIAMSMGKLGIISRLAVNLTNSSYTFASFREPSAPGQISYEKTKEMLKLLSVY